MTQIETTYIENVFGDDSITTLMLVDVSTYQLQKHAKLRSFHILPFDFRHAELGIGQRLAAFESRLSRYS